MIAFSLASYLKMVYAAGLNILDVARLLVHFWDSVVGFV